VDSLHPHSTRGWPGRAGAAFNLDYINSSYFSVAWHHSQNTDQTPGRLLQASSDSPPLSSLTLCRLVCSHNSRSHQIIKPTPCLNINRHVSLTSCHRTRLQKIKIHCIPKMNCSNKSFQDLPNFDLNFITFILPEFSRYYRSLVWLILTKHH